MAEGKEAWEGVSLLSVVRLHSRKRSMQCLNELQHLLSDSWLLEQGLTSAWRLILYSCLVVYPRYEWAGMIVKGKWSSSLLGTLEIAIGGRGGGGGGGGC